MPVTVVHDAVTKQHYRVGWDMCGRCFHYVPGNCTCAAGPLEPVYIRHWNGSVVESYIASEPRPDDAPRTVAWVMPEGFQKAERDPVTGRKIRKDKGKRRAYAEKPVGKIEVVEAEGNTYPCKMHTSESRVTETGKYVCTVPGCPGLS